MGEKTTALLQWLSPDNNPFGSAEGVTVVGIGHALEEWRRIANAGQFVDKRLRATSNFLQVPEWNKCDMLTKYQKPIYQFLAVQISDKMHVLLLSLAEAGDLFDFITKRKDGDGLCDVIPDVGFYLLDAHETLIAKCPRSPDYDKETLRPILIEILLLSARLSYIKSEHLEVIEKGWPKDKRQAYCLLLKNMILQPEQVSTFSGSNLERVLCAEKIVDTEERKMVGDATSGTSSTDLLMLSSLEPSAASAESLFKALAAATFEDSTTGQSIKEQVVKELCAKMSAYQSVVGKESSAYLALVVATWNMEQLTTSYIECLQQKKPFASALPGVLYGLSILHKRADDSRQRIACGMGGFRDAADLVAMLDGLAQSPSHLCKGRS